MGVSSGVSEVQGYQMQMRPEMRHGAKGVGTATLKQSNNRRAPHAKEEGVGRRV